MPLNKTQSLKHFFCLPVLQRLLFPFMTPTFHGIIFGRCDSFFFLSFFFLPRRMFQSNPGHGTSMKSYPNGVFYWPGRSSTGVDLVVYSHTRLCGHFTLWAFHPLPPQKKKTETETTDRGRKEETDQHIFRAAKLKKWNLALFSILCLFVMANARTLRKSHTATKNADSSGHRDHCSVSRLHAPESHSWLNDPLPRTDCFGVSLLTSAMSESPLRGLILNWTDPLLCTDYFSVPDRLLLSSGLTASGSHL